MNKRFKAACLTTFAVSMIAVPAQARNIIDSIVSNDVVDSVVNNEYVHSIISNNLVRTSSGIVLTISTLESLARYGSTAFSVVGKVPKSRNGQTIKFASAASLLATVCGAMCGIENKDLVAPACFGIGSLLYGRYAGNNKRIVDTAIESITEQKQDDEQKNSFSDGHVIHDGQSPEQVNFNVWLKKEAISFEAIKIKDESNDLVCKLIKDSTSDNNGAPARIDLGEFAINDNDDDHAKKIKICNAVAKEFETLEKNLDDLGNLLHGSGFVTALDEFFTTLMNELEIKSMCELPENIESKFFDYARKFQKNFVEEGNMLSSWIPQFEEASEQYIEVAIMKIKLGVLLSRLIKEFGFSFQEA